MRRLLILALVVLLVLALPVSGAHSGEPLQCILKAVNHGPDYLCWPRL